MEKCHICGGVDTCPAGKYSDVKAPVDNVDIRYWTGEKIPEGWVLTHSRKRYSVIVREKNGDGYGLIFVGSMQRHRIEAHYGVRPVWVGQCEYAIYVRPWVEGYLTHKPFSELGEVCHEWF